MVAISIPPDGTLHGPCTSMSYADYSIRGNLLLLLKSNPMRALFDFAALLYCQHFLGHPIKFLQHDRLATHARHERKHERALIAFVESGADLGIERAAAAHAAQSHVGLDHAHHFELAENLAHALGGVGPDGAQPHQTDLQTLIAHVLNGESRRHRVRALQEKDDVGVIRHEFFKPGVVAPSEDFRELVVDLLDDRSEEHTSELQS